MRFPPARAPTPRRHCLRWTTPGSPIAWRRSRRCSSSPTRIPTRSAPTAAPPRRSVQRRSRSTGSCDRGGCASCAGSVPGSRGGCASWSRPVRSPSWPSSNASWRRVSSASAAISGSVRSGRSRSRGRWASARPRSSGRPRRPAGCGPCRGSGPRSSGRSSRRSPGSPSRGRSAGCCSPAPASSWTASRTPSTASPPATCGDGATRARRSRWSAPRRIPPPCRRASPSCPRSSP